MLIVRFLLLMTCLFWSGPAWSAIAYGDIDSVGTKQIFLIDQSGRRQLTVGTSHSVRPDISPDGSLVAYVALVPGVGTEIRSVDVDGVVIERITTATSGEMHLTPAWSPDGQRFAFARSLCPGCSANIWIMDADGDNSWPLTIDGGLYPTWSPDGTKIAFFSTRDGGLAQIWTIDVESGRTKRLTTAFYDDTLDAYIEQKVPSWSPDGRYIAYFQGVEMTDPRPTGEVPRNVWIMRRNGRHARPLMTGDDPKWSPDSRTIILPINIPLENTGLPLGVGAINIDGSNFRVLFYTNGFFSGVDWSSR